MSPPQPPTSRTQQRPPLPATLLLPRLPPPACGSAVDHPAPRGLSVLPGSGAEPLRRPGKFPSTGHRPCHPRPLGRWPWNRSRGKRGEVLLNHSGVSWDWGARQAGTPPVSILQPPTSSSELEARSPQGWGGAREGHPACLCAPTSQVHVAVCPSQTPPVTRHPVYTPLLSAVPCVGEHVLATVNVDICPEGPQPQGRQNPGPELESLARSCLLRPRPGSGPAWGKFKSCLSHRPHALQTPGSNYRPLWSPVPRLLLGTSWLLPS